MFDKEEEIKDRVKRLLEDLSDREKQELKKAVSKIISLPQFQILKE